MKSAMQVVPQHEYPAYRLVIHHDQREDFSVYRPAGFILRWYALTLDLTLSAPLDVLIHLPFTRYLERLNAYGHGGMHMALSLALTAMPLTFYFVGPTLIWGQTLGKRIVGIRVVTASGSGDLSFGAIFLRESVGKLLSLALLGIGFLMAGMGLRKRALHDLLADTAVVTFHE